MNKYLKLWTKAFALAVAEDMAYKWNFIIKCFALVLVDFIGPLVAVLIYTTSAGIPGWSFEEYILFTGTVTFVLGLGHVFTVRFAWQTIKDIRRGEFDKIMVKPMRPLVYLTLTSWDLEGFAEVAAGLVMLIWSLTQLWANITLGHALIFILLVAGGFLFDYSAKVLISAIAFLAVQSMGLFDLMWNVTKFARYPLNIFGAGTRFFFTFLFPLALAAHYPVTALLHGMEGLMILQVLLPVIAFFGFTLLMWVWAMKKYTSAGG